MGQCFRLVENIIDRLANQSEREAAPPHLTLQAIFNQVAMQDVIEAISAVAHRSEGFEAEVSGLGILPSPYDPSIKYIYLKVEPSESLVRLYTELKQSLQAIGAETYPFEPRDWIPHLTVASGKWTMAKAKQIAQYRLGHQMGTAKWNCYFLVRALELHRAEPSGKWTVVQRFPLQHPGCQLENKSSP